LELLRSQGLGVLCGLSTVVLLGVGSFVIPATREGASAGVGFDDITAFFEEPSAVHAWFYLLLLVMVVYGVNTAYATLHSVVRKWRQGVRRISSYAPALFHVGFLVALVAHLIGGTLTEDREPMVIGPEWTELGEGHDVRLLSMDITRHPTGAPRGITGHVQLRDSDGKVTADAVGFNDPIATNLGVDLALLANYVPALPTARLRVGEQTCRLIREEICRTPDFRIELAGLTSPPSGGFAAASAMLTATPNDGGEAHRTFVTGTRPAKLPNGTEVSLAAVEFYPAVLVRRRHAPGNPWALAAALFLTIGVVMMGRRWLM
jgi:hypothetical protein